MIIKKQTDGNITHIEITNEGRTITFDHEGGSQTINEVLYSILSSAWLYETFEDLDHYLQEMPISGSVEKYNVLKKSYEDVIYLCGDLDTYESLKIRYCYDR